MSTPKKITKKTVTQVRREVVDKLFADNNTGSITAKDLRIAFDLVFDAIKEAK